MKARIDTLLHNKGLVKSRTSAAELIKAGRVQVNGEIIQKPSTQFEETIEIKILGDQKIYVGRGALKLERALTEFKLEVKDFVVIDVGSSTGGFTELLLERGTKKVYAVDVGTDQLDPKLKDDPRVVSMEQTDIRNVEKLPEKPDLAVIDVSFISLELVLEKVASLLKKDGQIIALVKPQFETAWEAKNKNGIVTDENIRKESLEKIKDFAKSIKLKILTETTSPILGGSGNEEYLLYLQK